MFSAVCLIWGLVWRGTENTQSVSALQKGLVLFRVLGVSQSVPRTYFSLTFFLSHQDEIKGYLYSTIIPATGCIKSFSAIIAKDMCTYILAIKEKTLLECIILLGCETLKHKPKLHSTAK